MPQTMIKGSFRITDTSPDGDSIRFYPDDPDAFDKAGIKAKVNSRGGTQLRLDAIDALETHYQPRSAHRQWRQPAELGDAASAALLDALGFRDVKRDKDGTVTGSDPAEAPGYILTRFADTYGRVVSFVFTGSRRASKNNDVWLDPTMLRKSVNYKLLADGLVYPTFYSKLYPDLREALAKAAVQAREAKKGVWVEDATLPGFTLRSREQLVNELVILPKLFRRLAEYLELDNSGRVSLSRFKKYLATQDDRLFTVPEGHSTGFDTLLEVHRQQIKLTVPPERIVFLEA